MAKPGSVTRGSVSRPPLIARAILVLLVAALTSATVSGGCATLPPAQPVPDVATIAGKWSGNIQFGRGPYELFYVTINPDGSLVASWGITTRWGKVSVNDGRARFDLYIWSGDLQYLAGDGQRVLIFRETFESFYAQVTPQR
jgi:hypothetical protein